MAWASPEIFVVGGGGGQAAKRTSIKNEKGPHIAKKGPIRRKKLLKDHHMEKKPPSQ